MSRLSEQGGMPEDAGDFLFDMIRAKDVQQVRYDKRSPPEECDFTKKERDTLYVGLKNMITAKRSALRVLLQIKENPKYTRYMKAQDLYIIKLREEISRVCQSIIDINSNYTLDRKGHSMES